MNERRARPLQAFTSSRPFACVALDGFTARSEAEVDTQVTAGPAAEKRQLLREGCAVSQ